MADYIVTVDVYMFDRSDKTTAIDQVMATLHQGGLEGDVLDVQEGSRDDEADSQGAQSFPTITR